MKEKIYKIIVCEICYPRYRNIFRQIHTKKFILQSHLATLKRLRRSISERWKNDAHKYDVGPAPHRVVTSASSAYTHRE